MSFWKAQVKTPSGYRAWSTLEARGYADALNLFEAQYGKGNVSAVMPDSDRNRELEQKLKEEDRARHEEKEAKRAQLLTEEAQRREIAAISRRLEDAREATKEAERTAQAHRDRAQREEERAGHEDRLPQTVAGESQELPGDDTGAAIDESPGDAEARRTVADEMLAEAEAIDARSRELVSTTRGMKAAGLHVAPGYLAGELEELLARQKKLEGTIGQWNEQRSVDQQAAAEVSGVSWRGWLSYSWRVDLLFVVVGAAVLAFGPWLTKVDWVTYLVLGCLLLAYIGWLFIALNSYRKRR